MNFERPFVMVLSVLACVCCVMYMLGYFVRYTPLAYDVWTAAPPLSIHYVVFFTLAVGALSGIAIAKYFHGGVVFLLSTFTILFFTFGLGMKPVSWLHLAVFICYPVGMGAAWIGVGLLQQMESEEI